MADIFLKQKDRLPKLRATLMDGNGPINLTGATVKVWFRLKAGGEGSERSGNCTIIDPENGVVEYAWAAGDTDVPGDYYVEFVVTITGMTMTFPNDGYLSMTILPDLDSSD